MSDWPKIKEIADDVNSGKVSARSLVEKSLAEIAKHDDYKAIVAVLDKLAIKKAKSIDNKISKGESAGRLAGVPFIAKDNFLVFGGETTASSNMLRGFTAPYQATAIEKLEKEGAICVAKANLDAFAHGSSTENSDFFTTSNPHNKEYVPGGSSGGSAASVVLGIAPFALGSDTGGSIRLPASFSGCVGYKPSYGLISRSGVVAMASSTDVVGPLARNSEDVALLIDVMSGLDPLDSTTFDSSDIDFLPNKELTMKDQKVGVIKEYMTDGLSDDVKLGIQNAIAKLKKAGAEVVEVSLPSLPLALAVYYVVCPAELSSNMARYDGQRYGFTDPEAKDLNDSYVGSRSKGLNKENKRRIMIGTYVLSSGYYDAYYKKAQTVRTKLINEFNEVFKKVDFLVGPTAPQTAFKIGENISDPLKMYLIDIMTVSASLVGIPAISIPVATTSELPIGLQIMAKYGHDKELLNLAVKSESLIK